MLLLELLLIQVLNLKKKKKKKYIFGNFTQDIRFQNLLSIFLHRYIIKSNYFGIEMCLDTCFRDSIDCTDV
jgi:hypothetical protein